MKILVIGDTIMDDFVECEKAHLAQEAPVVCANVTNTKGYKGGAHAVRENCNTLFGAEKVDYFSNVEILSRKRRYLVDGHLLFRTDEHRTTELTSQIQEDLERDLALVIHQYDVVLIADYGKGTVTERVLKICNGAKCVILDPHPSRVPYIDFKPTVYMPNRFELESLTQAEHIITTLDSDGVFSTECGDVPSENDNPRTVIGAGGAFMAAYAYSWIGCKRSDASDNIRFALRYVAEAMKQPYRCVLHEWP